MAGGIEGWHFFDVESGQVPDASAPSLLPGGGRGRIVVLAATPFARKESWAARAAAILAREWAKEGLRIFLMDLGLEDPSLHDVLGLPNEEGVSDAFLFGASIQHIAKPALDNGVFFASAGAPPGDPQEVLGHPRWNDLAGGFSEAEATLLLFLPTEIPGAEKILSRATEILFLAARGEPPETHLGPASIKVVTTLGPLGTPSEEEEVRGEDLVSPSEPPGIEETELGAEAEERSPAGLDRPVDSPPFDFEGGLELAEGFGVDSPEEDLLPTFEETGSPFAPEPTEDGTGEEVETAGSGLDGTRAHGASPAEGEQESGAEANQAVLGDGSLDSGFGDQLVMGASLGEGQAADPPALSEEEEVRSTAPDFDADFVDLPSIETPPTVEKTGGDFGADLVQGPDFGGPPSPGVEMEGTGPRPSSPAPPPGISPPGTRQRRVPEERIPPERRRPPRRKPPKRKFPWGAVAVVALALAFLGAAIGTALGYVNVPGFTFLRGFLAEEPDPPLTLAGPQANEEVLRYSLVLFSYDQEELTSGLEMLDALQERLPDLLLTLVPGEAGGRRTYTLLAGPAVDRVEAENLRGPIAEVLTREDPASWSVRETPRAFYLGERGTLREARDYLESVTTGDLHAYILHVTFPEPEGSESYQVLTGAFAGVRDARPLQLILRELGFRDVPLIERRGRLPE
ncbi:MAG: hypothetical protein ACWGSQ_05315 [Longimicrobiales bacterium]